MKTSRIGIKISYTIGYILAAGLLAIFGAFYFFHDSFAAVITISMITFASVMAGVTFVIQKKLSEPLHEIVRYINDVPSADNRVEEARIGDKNTELYEICGAINTIIERINDASILLNKRKVIELQTVNQISMAMSARFNLEEVLKLIIDLATNVLDARYSSLMLLDEDTNELTIKVSNGMAEEIMKKVRIKVGQGIAGTVAYEGKPYLSTNIEQDPRFKKAANPKFDTKSFIVFPIKLAEKVIGVISVNDKKSHDIFTQSDLDLLNILASQAAVAIDNSRLYQQAEKKVEELEMLFSASKVMSSILDVSMLLRQVLETCIHIVFAKAGMILLFNENSMQFEVKTSHGPIDARCTYEFRIDKNSDIGERMVRDLNAEVVSNIDENIDFADLTNYLKFMVKQIICMPLHSKQKLTGMLLIISEANQNSFTMNDVNLLSALSSQAAVVIENARLYEGMKDQFLSTIRVATNALEFKDAYTSGHSERVTEYAVLLAKEINLPHEIIEHIRQAAILHDIGKIGISETILTKKGRLTDEEFATIKLHPAIGDSIVEPMVLHPIVKAGIRNHHERWDGRGYPDGLAGEQIPLGARIIAIADSYDAMTSNRPYRDALGMDKVYNEFIRCGGSQFDPTLAEIFVKMLRRINNIGAVAVEKKEDEQQAASQAPAPQQNTDGKTPMSVISSPATSERKDGASGAAQPPEKAKENAELK